MRHDSLTECIIGAAMEVHRELGPGLLESAYCRCLMHELAIRGIAFRSEIPFPLVYKELHLEYGYRADLLVEERVFVEVKAVEALTPVHEAQVLTYLRLSGRDTGLLINFNVLLLKQGVRRLVLNRKESNAESKEMVEDR
ncbi:GxxExxY protein [bacterium]|nr:MAG: GxxExxY protein [bacterium]